MNDQPMATTGQRVPRLTVPFRLYQVPGYGPAYRGVQRFLHRHGVCVLRRRPVIDGDRLWWCTWCGHRAVDRSDGRNPS